MVPLLATSVIEGQSPVSLHPESSRGAQEGRLQWLPAQWPQHPLFTDTALVEKNLPAVGFSWDWGLIPGLGRSPGEGPGHPLQYSRLENPMDRGAWQATVHRVAKSRTRLKRQHACPRQATFSIHAVREFTSAGQWGGGEQSVFSTFFCLRHVGNSICYSRTCFFWAQNVCYRRRSG